MKKKNIGLIILTLVLIFVGYSYWSKVQKDNWLKEPSTVRYSEAKENEVWGGVLRGDDAGLFYGTPLYDLADEMSNFSFRYRRLGRPISKIKLPLSNGYKGKIYGSEFNYI